MTSSTLMTLVQATKIINRRVQQILPTKIIWQMIWRTSFQTYRLQIQIISQLLGKIISMIFLQDLVNLLLLHPTSHRHRRQLETNSPCLEVSTITKINSLKWTTIRCRCSKISSRLALIYLEWIHLRWTRETLLLEAMLCLSKTIHSSHNKCQWTITQWWCSSNNSRWWWCSSSSRWIMPLPKEQEIHSMIS